MSNASEEGKGARLGRIEVTPGGGAVTIHRWVPPLTLAAELPPGFTFPLRCVADGQVRRFYPVNEGESRHVANAFAGGLAILGRVKNFTPERRSEYRMMWLLLQRLRDGRDQLRNKLATSASLLRRKSVRGLEAVSTILPESVGKGTAAPEGKTWSLGTLLDEGRREAERRGLADPAEDELIALGLFRAASLDPLHAREEEVPGLVRMALYSQPEGDPPSKDVEEEVIGRAMDAIKPHLGDDTADFNGWFVGWTESFVRTIAKRKRALFKELKTAVVRRVLADQGWLAHSYVGDCLHVMLHCFRRLLPVPLSETETRIFERMHLRQPCFGGLPAALLSARFPLLTPVLTDVFEDPDNRVAVAIMHRILQYYEEMATSRRALDSQAKRRGKAARGKGQAVLDVPYLGDPAVCAGSEERGEASEGTRLDDVAEKLARMEGLTCRCELPDWEMRSLGEGGAGASLAFYCRGCSVEHLRTMSLAQMRRACCG
jgi:hypothetical protein